MSDKNRLRSSQNTTGRALIAIVVQLFLVRCVTY